MVKARGIKPQKKFIAVRRFHMFIKRIIYHFFLFVNRFLIIILKKNVEDKKSSPHIYFLTNEIADFAAKAPSETAL